jgi:hypothetical protein
MIARALAGCLLGAGAAAATLASVGRSREAAREARAPEAAEPLASLDDLRAAVEDAEARAEALPENGLPPAALDRPTAAARAYGAALREGVDSSAATRAVVDVERTLDRHRFEHLLSEDEMLIVPARDAMVPALLDALGLPLTPDQAARWASMMLEEDAAWAARVEARGRETLLARDAEALELAVRFEAWRDSILDAKQQAALGAASGTEFVVLGPRRSLAGWAGGAPSLGETLRDLIATSDEGARRTRNEGNEAAKRLNDLGPAQTDAAGRLPLAYRLAQARILADMQRKLLAMDGWTEQELQALRRYLP